MTVPPRNKMNRMTPIILKLEGDRAERGYGTPIKQQEQYDPRNIETGRLNEDGYNQNQSNRDIESDYGDMPELIGDSDSEDEEPTYIPKQSKVSASNMEKE